MTTGFWQQFKKPIFALAPLANVTDAAFRQIIAKYGKPDVMFTEFTSCDGLQSPGRDNIMIDLTYTPAERPIVAQIFGSKPDNFYKTALLLQELGFDGIDINMGCPDKNVEKQCAGAALMKDLPLAQKCILETMRGAGQLPVSIKTRVGFNKVEIDTWLPALLETKPAAITLHARTRKEMSNVPARWEQVAQAVQIRDRMCKGVLQYAPTAPTLILGNGDVQNLAQARERVAQTGCDGVMIGRGIFGNPWLFADKESFRLSSPFRGGTKGWVSADDNTPSFILPLKGGGVTIAEKLRVMVEHTKLFAKLLGAHKSFNIMKKHYKAYVNGFDGAKELRLALMERASDAAAVDRIVKAWLNK